MPDSTDPAGGPFENFGRKVDQHLGGISGRVEDDVRRVIAYLNDRVVPEVRQNSSVALRVAAQQLNRLAEHLESRSRTQPADAPRNPPEPEAQSEPGPEPPDQQ